MSRGIVVSSPRSIELVEEALDPQDVITGAPVTREAEIASASLAGGTTMTTGVWRCSEGRVRDIESDESFIVLSGRATIEHAGRSHEVGPGDVCVLPAGARTEWTIHEALTKVFVIAEPA